MSDHKYAPFLFRIEHCNELVPDKIGPMPIEQYDVSPQVQRNMDYVLSVTGIENHKDLFNSKTFQEVNKTWREAYFSPIVKSS